MITVNELKIHETVASKKTNLPFVELFQDVVIGNPFWCPEAGLLSGPGFSMFKGIVKFSILGKFHRFLEVC